MAKMGDYPELDTKYPPSTQGTKNTAFKNSANVLVTGEATSGSKEQLNIPLSQIQGDKLPSGGSTGQFIKKTGDSTVGWGDVHEVPTTGGNEGDVLTKGANNTYSWQQPSGGGGGGGYTRATAAFGEQYSKPYPWWPEGSGKTQDITVANNSYTTATNFIPAYRYYDAGEDDDIEVKGSNMFVINVSADFPMAIVRLELSKCAEWLPEGANSFSFDLAYHPDYAIMVKNGNKTLKRLYPLAIDYQASEASYTYNNLCQAEVIEVHILGDSFTIFSSNGPVDGLSV